MLQGVHPSTIVRGYRMAKPEAMAHLEELAFEGSEEDLTTAVRSSLAGKASRAVQDRLADLAMEAAMCVERTVDGVFEVDPTRVSTVMAVGRPATDSEIVEGLVLQKRRAHPDMVKLVENGTIALLDGGLERRKMRGDVTFQATTPTSWTPSAAVKSNACWTTSRRSRPLVWTSWPSQEPLTTRRTGACLTLAFKPSAGCLGTIWTCSLATGATVLHHVDALHADACGRVLESRSHMLGDLHHWTVRGEGHAATLIARGSGDEIVEETSRCFDDALGVAAHLRKDGRLLVGGGASHVHLARHLRRFAEATPGESKWPSRLSLTPWKSFRAPWQKTLAWTRSTRCST